MHKLNYYLFNFFHLVTKSPLSVFTSILLSLTTIGLFSMYGYNFASVLFLPLLFILVFNMGIWFFDFYSFSEENKTYLINKLITIVIIIIHILCIIFICTWMNVDILCEPLNPDPIIVADPLKQLSRGYDSEAMNQPLLRNIAQVLSDQRDTYKVLTHAFTPEMRNFVASYLFDKDIDTYYNLLNAKTDSFTAWSKINNTISFRAGLLAAT